MVEKLIKIALDEVGYLEKNSNTSLNLKTANAGNKNYTKYARDMMKYDAGIYANGHAWCDTFVDWCFVQAFGVDKAKQMLIGWSAYTPTSSGYFKNKKQWHTKKPQKGDIIFFKNNSGIICHTGIVYVVDSNYVYTVEGNTSSANGVVDNGGAVEKKKYDITYNRIAGYGRPVYSKENKKLESGNDIVWELMNGKHKIEITEVKRAIRAIDEAKADTRYASLYWILYKLVNGNG